MHIVARFYETYNICDVVSGLLRNTLDHALLLEGFHCDERWSAWLNPYEKQSVLHLFIEFVVQGMHSEQSDSFRSEEHTSELQSLMRISYAVFCLKKKKTTNKITQ